MDTGAGRPLETAGSQLALLHRISGIVSSSLTLQKMLEELVGLVVSVTVCDACLVYLVDEPAGEIVLWASQLPHATEIGEIRMKIGEGVTGWVAQHRSVVALSSEASRTPDSSRSSLPEDTYEAFLSVPLINSGEVIGVINVHHKRSRHTPRRKSRCSVTWPNRWAAQSPKADCRNNHRLRQKSRMLPAVGRHDQQRRFSGPDSSDDFRNGGGDIRILRCVRS